MCQASQTNSPRGVFSASVFTNERICAEHYRIRLEMDEFPTCQAGQFVQVLCAESSEDNLSPRVIADGDGLPRLENLESVHSLPLLRRPFSMAGCRNVGGGGVELEIIYRTVGVGTHLLGETARGSVLSVLGPLGNGFSIPADKSVAVVIAGGVGVGPMLFAAEMLALEGKKVIAFCGARTSELLPLTIDEKVKIPPDARPTNAAMEFALRGAQSVITTDDGSLGFPGFVANAFETWLTCEQISPESLAVFTCGPEPMMREVSRICLKNDIHCQLAMERKMSCGMGTCQSCIVRVKKEFSPTGYKLCCSDGPVFDAKEVIFD